MKQLPALLLLQILREETDAEHRLTQQQLRDRLQTRFGVELDRRTLKSYLDALRAAGYPLNFAAYERETVGSAMQSKWYLEPELESSELRLLSDLLAAAPALPETQRQALMEKLLRHAAPTARTWEAHIAPVHMQKTANPQLLLTVELLCEAMEKDRIVQFQYCSYEVGEDMQPVLKPRRADDGKPKLYTVSPYQIAVSHGQYYLLCCTEPHDNLSSYRLDRIAECVLTRKKRRPAEEIAGGVQLPEHLAEHLYMYTGEPVTCRFLVGASRIGDVIDWFGQSAEIAPAEDETQLLVTVHVHPTAMRHWALQYGRYVTVLEPASLREAIAEEVQSLAARYGAEPPQSSASASLPHDTGQLRQNMLK